MKYFRLTRPDDGDAEQEFAVAEPSNLQGLSDWAVLNGESISMWPAGVEFSTSNGRLEDFITNSLGWPMVSSRVRTALSAVDPTEAQFFPISVLAPDGAQVSPSYFVLNVASTRSAFDPARSVWTPLPGMVGVTGVKKYVLKAKELVGADVFRLAENKNSVFVSESVKMALDSLKASGVAYQEIAVS